MRRIFTKKKLLEVFSIRGLFISHFLKLLLAPSLRSYTWPLHIYFVDFSVIPIDIFYCEVQLVIIMIDRVCYWLIILGNIEGLTGLMVIRCKTMLKWRYSLNANANF